LIFLTELLARFIGNNVPEKPIYAVAYNANEVVALVNNEVDDARQNQLAESDAELADRQEAFQVRVGEALDNLTSDLDDPLGVSLAVWDNPERVTRIHDGTKSCGVHGERHWSAVTIGRERSDVIDLERRALKDIRHNLRILRFGKFLAAGSRQHRIKSISANLE